MPKEIKTISICEDANGDNEKPIYEDAECDNVPFFDESDFEHFDWGTFLPHWHQDGKYVFITFRLHDSLPQEKLDWLREEKESWLKRHPQPWDIKVSNRKIVEDALLFFNGKRYDLVAFVVMPNHVHILMKLKEGFELTEIMRSLKSYTAKEINKSEKKSGPVWQSESYDRLIRDEVHFDNVVRYIIANNKDLSWVASDIVNDCVPQSKR